MANVNDNLDDNKQEQIQEDLSVEIKENDQANIKDYLQEQENICNKKNELNISDEKNEPEKIINIDETNEQKNEENELMEAENKDGIEETEKKIEANKDEQQELLMDTNKDNQEKQDINDIKTSEIVEKINDNGKEIEIKDDEQDKILKEENLEVKIEKNINQNEIHENEIKIETNEAQKNKNDLIKEENIKEESTPIINIEAELKNEEIKPEKQEENQTKVIEKENINLVSEEEPKTKIENTNEKKEIKQEENLVDGYKKSNLNVISQNEKKINIFNSLNISNKSENMNFNYYYNGKVNLSYKPKIQLGKKIIHRCSQSNSDLNNINTRCEEKKQEKQRYKINPINESIIKGKVELKLIEERIHRSKYSITYNLLYKASLDKDESKIFHEKCDKSQSTLILIETTNGMRFGWFTNRTWKGNNKEKSDDEAFVFSLDKKKIYNIIKGKNAIVCNEEFGPMFIGAFKIMDNSFTNGGIAYVKGDNFEFDQDYELTEGEEKFLVKEIEVYEIGIGK